MIYVDIPATGERHPLPFYLAMEEYVLETMSKGSYPKAEDCFFMWQVNPTVIFGRNQIGSREIDVDYCRAHGIDMCRRRSGGGCVFADDSNIMFSYMTTQPQAVDGIYRHYTSMVVEMLRSLGLDASSNSRNDFLIGTRKVSGNAYYRTAKGSIVHGTMLFDTDMELMMNALTPSAAKLSSKGVSSVASRITTLSRHLSIDKEQFKTYARKHLCDKSVMLTEADIAEIEKIAKPYRDPDWVWGLDNRLNAKLKPQRVDGAGEFWVHTHLDPSTGLINSVNLAGDFLLKADLDRSLLNRLQGAEPTREGLRQALADAPEVGSIIAGLDNEKFIDLIIS